MVLEYLPTCAQDKSASSVGKYTSTMELAASLAVSLAQANGSVKIYSITAS